jgi:ankyrin repeat protein
MKRIFTNSLVHGVALAALSAVDFAYAAEPPTSPPLLEAAYADNTEAAKALLAKGYEADATNRYGVTPLALACQNGNAELVTALLSANADPDKAINSGDRPLMIAARTGKPASVQSLIDAGAEVDATNRSGQTALTWAANEGHLEVVDLLLKAGAAPDLTLKSGLTPLMLAARNGHISVTKSLLATGIDLAAATQVGQANGKAPPKGTTALTLAVENAHFDLALALLEAGADANDQRSGLAPLHRLIHVRKPNRGDGDDGLPPPLGSGKTTSLDFARILVEKYQADPNLQLRYGSAGGRKFGTRGATPFLLACRTGDLAYLKVLADLGADPSITNGDGTTALMAAAGVGSHAPEEEAGSEADALKTVEWLIANQHDTAINAVNKYGETTMHGAAYRNRPKMVSLLVEHGADIEVWNQKNKHGWTPLLIARGYRPGNFKPSVPTGDAIKAAMLAAGVEVPPHPPLPTTEKPKKYEQ